MTVDDQPAGSAAAETEVAQVERAGWAIAAERQTLFSDAVIAIAITLLALDLPKPEGTTNAEMLRSAVGDRGEYLAFLISFVVIWAHWSAHHRTFRYVTGFDSRLGTLNTLWLLMQVVTPFATRVISGDGAFQVRFGFYALVQAIASTLFMLMVVHIRRAGLFRRGTPLRVFEAGVVRSLTLVAAFLISIPVSFLTDYSWVCWIVIPFLATPTLLLWHRLRATPRAGTPSAAVPQTDNAVRGE